MKQNKAREQLINHILKVLEKGEIPFSGKWIGAMNNYNATTNKAYRGINQLLLSYIASERGISDPRWVTFAQANRNEWKVKKGSKGVPVEFWSMYDVKQKKTITITEANKLIAEDEKYKKNIKPVSNVYIVFNAVDIDGITPLVDEKMIDQDMKDILSFQVLNNYLENESIDIFNGGNSAYYRQSDDSIHLPAVTSFKTEYDYLSVLAHEICHSTGNEKRMNRSLVNNTKKEEYAKEELRAEIGSSFLCNDLYLECSDHDIQNHQAYIKHWINIVTDEPTELFRAINDAQKISDYVLEHGDYELLKERADFEYEMTSEEKDLGFCLERNY